MSENQKLVVEVADACNLLPIDGHGTSSPYVTIDFHGQRKRTRTAIRDLSPTWNEPLVFDFAKPSDVFNDIIELHVLHDKSYGQTTRSNCLGRLRLSSSQSVSKGEEALIYYSLEKKHLLTPVKGEIGLKIYYYSPPPAVESKPEGSGKANSTAQPEQSQPVEADERTAETVKEAPPAADDGSAPVEGENPPETITAPLPPESENQEEPPAKDVDGDVILEPPANNSPEIMAAAVCGSVPEVKIAGINAPQPIVRPVGAPSANYGLESQESISIERSSFDLVEKMHYLFVRVVKAQGLPTNGNPIVTIATSGRRVHSKPARKVVFFEWDQTFAFSRDAPESSSTLEVSVWDTPNTELTSDVAGAKFLGGICFDATEIPLRDPPDSPLAPQWYMLEGDGTHDRKLGNLMLATWVGTQADESFPDAWKTDTASNVNARAKVYQSPKLWYLRATVVEAQDILSWAHLKDAQYQIKAQLGFQVQKTKPTPTRNGNPSWNEDLLIVAAEPFTDHLILTLENHRHSKGSTAVGISRIPLTTIERRVDDRKIASKWISFEDPNNEKVIYKGRVQLKLCFDGRYHVIDEAANVCSDYRPTARQLWKPPVGIVELGVIGCKNLVPMKTVEGKGCTDAYCVAKYGPKWIRTRTICDSLDPKWNEQYTWKVFDPSTVLSIGVFDSSGVMESDSEKLVTRPDIRIGKILIRISTLETGKVYKNLYPLVLLTNNGVKKMGDIEVAVRFIRTTPNLDFLYVYSQPLMPLMHHLKPLGVIHQEMLRGIAVKIIAGHLGRSEPPLRREVVFYMLDAESHSFSMRKVRANWFRIINVIAGVLDIIRWIDDTRVWKNPTATVLVHVLLVMLVWFPDLIVPTFAFYMFAIGAWNYRFRTRDPLPHFDPKISLAETVDREELDEEFDTIPSNRSPDIIRARYDKLRTLGIRVQKVLGDLATQGERVQALVTWRDPRATGIFVGLCLLVAVTLYLVPSKMVAMVFGFYFFRHPIFRDQMPSPALNFFRRLPSLCDRIM